jgi:uncharacterized damage-inducible protein DinB
MHPDLQTFLEYLASVHARTRRVVACIPAEALEWVPAPGRWSAGDQVRHLAAIERHEESRAVFAALTPAQWAGRTTTPAGVAITTWKWLRAMVEHEAHHRGQLYFTLGLLGVPTPPIYGLTEPELLAQSAQRGVAADDASRFG